jgi:hypothetical protein
LEVEEDLTVLDHLLIFIPLLLQVEEEVEVTKQVVHQVDQVVVPEVINHLNNLVDLEYLEKEITEEMDHQEEHQEKVVEVVEQEEQVLQELVLMDQEELVDK